MITPPIYQLFNEIEAILALDESTYGGVKLHRIKLAVEKYKTGHDWARDLMTPTLPEQEERFIEQHYR